MTQEKTFNVEELMKGGVVELNEKDMYSIWVKTVCKKGNTEDRRFADDKQRTMQVLWPVHSDMSF